MKKVPEKHIINFFGLIGVILNTQRSPKNISIFFCKCSYESSIYFCRPAGVVETAMRSQIIGTTIHITHQAIIAHHPITHHPMVHPTARLTAHLTAPHAPHMAGTTVATSIMTVDITLFMQSLVEICIRKCVNFVNFFDNIYICVSVFEAYVMCCSCTFSHFAFLDCNKRHLCLFNPTKQV